MIVCDLEKYLEMKEQVVFSKFLSYRDRIVLLILIHYCTNGTNICRVSISNMMQYAGISNRKTMTSIIKHLEEHKYIKVIREGNKTNKYEILDIEQAEENANRLKNERKVLDISSEDLSEDIYNEITESNIAEIAKNCMNKERNDLIESKLEYLTEEKLSCDNKEKQNKNDITICYEYIKKLKVVVDDNNDGDINLTLYSSNKISTTGFKVGRFNIEFINEE